MIDFGISRVYDETAETDTVCFGTRHFAAPEQYGFSQTDARADIFSAGVLLGFLLTGETNSSSARSRIKNPRLRKIVEKCTAFAHGSATLAQTRSNQLCSAQTGEYSGRRYAQQLRLLHALSVFARDSIWAVIRKRRPRFFIRPACALRNRWWNRRCACCSIKRGNEPIDENDLLNITGTMDLRRQGR